jgi:hypothetical protein
MKSSHCHNFWWSKITNACVFTGGFGSTESKVVGLLQKDEKEAACNEAPEIKHCWLGMRLYSG